MKVRRLISLLSKLPPDAYVFREFYTCGETHRVPIEKDDIRLEESVVVIDSTEN